MANTVAVIGAGISGLSALKCSLEVGFQATCFEKSDCVGGLWNFMVWSHVYSHFSVHCNECIKTFFMWS